MAGKTYKPRKPSYPQEVSRIRNLPTPFTGSLLEEVRQFRMTPVQAVAQFFESGKPANTGINFWRALRDILELLPQCDWDNDPNVNRSDSDPSLRWVDTDPYSKAGVSLIFTSEESVIEHGVKPLVKQALEFQAWVEQITRKEIADPEAELRQLHKRAELASVIAQAASGLEGVFAEAGDNQHTLKGGGDNVTTYRANSTAKGNSAAYLAARLKKAGRDDLLAEIGPDKRSAGMKQRELHP